MKFGITFIAIIAICTCIEPYTPKLKGYDSNLVVDGLITDANASYTVRLTRTIQNQNDTSTSVSDATVSITDDVGNTGTLTSKGNGIYKTDSLEFRGMVGRTYVLHIIVGDGAVYESEPAKMQSVPDIDSIYYEKDQQLVNNGTQTQTGLSIYLDSKPGDNDQNYRWAFDESWEFKVPFPKKFDFNMADSVITAVANIKEYCWKSARSNDILIYSSYPGHSGPVTKQPIFFIAPDKSDRLMIEYSILVKQYSISKNEYDFWDNLTKVNTAGSDIFASQPFPVVSNIHNINSTGEKVLGYFQVSAVKEKRIFIPLSEIVRLHLPFYHYDQCVRMPDAPKFEQTWDDLYAEYCIYSYYDFIEPVYSPAGQLLQMVFTRPQCADCGFTGTQKKPDFWVDLK